MTTLLLLLTLLQTPPVEVDACYVELETLMTTTTGLMYVNAMNEDGQSVRPEETCCEDVSHFQITGFPATTEQWSIETLDWTGTRSYFPITMDPGGEFRLDLWAFPDPHCGVTLLDLWIVNESGMGMMHVQIRCNEVDCSEHVGG